ncbi:MAG: FecR domain-containing protein [Comamonadaceae bacterium]|nr:FecR domain-containing protein [Comamonadaceae bacterium]
MKFSSSVLLGALVALPLWGLQTVHAAIAAGSAAQIVSLQGAGEQRGGQSDAWATAKTSQLLAGGAYVRTLSASKMALLFADDTQLRLNQNSVLQVKAIANGAEPTSLMLSLGRAWAQTKRQNNSRLNLETPAATAGIRGTDWELDVDANGKTLLTVLSGKVEFANSLGAVTVNSNEAAMAEVGRAPIKILLTNPRDRVQWVNALTADPLRHLSADQVPPALKPALDALRNADLPVAAVVINASALAQPGPWHTIFSSAQALLAGDTALARRLLGGLMDAGSGAAPAAYLMLSDLQLVEGEFEAAAKTLEAGLNHYSDDPDLLAHLARVYLLADRLDDSANVLARVRVADSASVLLAQGDLARRKANAGATMQAYTRATVVAPGDDRAWLSLGSAQNEREEATPARSNLLRALEINPQGAGYRGELGTLETFTNQFSQADAAFNQALAQNPADYVALTGLGLLRLKQGQPEAALDAFLRAGVMEPRYARAHVYTAVAYYQMHRVEQALAELDRASQLDEKDPLPHFMASIIHSDGLRPELAIEQSRAALQRLPYLKSLNQLANDQQGLTNLGQAFAFLGMEEWSQRYAQDSYYPFWAGSHLFLADRYTGLFTKNSELFQGLLADPTVFGGGSGFQTLVPRPGHSGTVSMRATTAADSYHGTGPFVQASGFTNGTVPFAYFANREDLALDFKTGPWEQKTSTLALGVAPRHDTGVFVFVDRAKNMDDSIKTADFNLKQDLTSDRFDLGFHYKMSPKAQLWLKLGQFDSNDQTVGDLGGAPSVSMVDVRQPEWGLRHTFEASDNHEITWGIETGNRSTTANFDDLSDAKAGIVGNLNYVYGERSRDIFVSDRWRVSSKLLLQGGLFYQNHLRTADYVSSLLFDGKSIFPAQVKQESFSHSDVNARLGLVYRFDAGPQLRMAYQRWIRPSVFSSLGPVATVGIPLDDRLVMRGGELNRVRAQLEWEFSSRTFMSAHLDARDVNNNRFTLTPFSVNELESLAKLRPRRLGALSNDDMLEFVNTPEYDGGRIRSVGFAVNNLMGNNWGVFGRYVGNWSTNTGLAQAGKAVPYMPRHMAALGASWANPNGWYFISRLVYRAQRFKDEANLVSLEPGWNASLDLYWQSQDRHWLARFSADNVFDRDKPTQFTSEISYQF